MERQNPGLGDATGHAELIFAVAETQFTNDELLTIIDTETTVKKALIIAELTASLSSGVSGGVSGVVSFNGLTGAVQGVSDISGVTGSVASFDGGDFS